MLRHLRFKHQDESGSSLTGVAESSSGTEATSEEHQQFCSVEVSLEEGDTQSINTLNESAVNSILEASQAAPAEVIEGTGISDNSSKYRYRHRRSLIWNYYEVLDSVRAVKCLLCMKKLKSCKSGNTSNLRRHISKKHPETFSEILTNGQPPPFLKISHVASVANEVCDESSPPKSPEVSNAIEETSENLGLETPPQISIVIEEAPENSRLREMTQVTNANGVTLENFRLVKSSQSSKASRKPHEILYAAEIPGSFKFSGTSESEGLALKRELELIEALRRAQKEEARTLEHQRELLEKLRAADAREVAAEREKIELLRQIQQKEAEELRRQRDELEKDRMELEKQRQELLQQK